VLEIEDPISHPKSLILLYLVSIWVGAKVKTPLQRMLDNFKRGYTGNYRVELTPQNLWKFCQIYWVSFKVGWPSKGSLDQETIHRGCQVATGTPGHPDQFPYINIWQTLAAHLGLKRCFEDNCRILMTETMTTGSVKRKKEALKLWTLKSLPICLKYPLTASPEARQQWLPPNIQSLSSQSSNSDFAPLCGPDTSRSNLLLMFGLKRYIILHPVGTCEPTHLCFPMGGPPIRGGYSN
jgi:hypothetical protein